jgi:hypothetical protein
MLHAVVHFSDGLYQKVLKYNLSNLLVSEIIILTCACGSVVFKMIISFESDIENSFICHCFTNHILHGASS